MLSCGARTKPLLVAGSTCFGSRFDLREAAVTEEMMNRLACRAYMYELLHVIFGAVPDQDGLDRLRSEETFQVLGYYAALQSDPVRADVFDACCKLFENPAGADCGEDAVAVLESSFTRLFMVPGAEYVHPWESPYVGKEVTIFQESTLDVRKRYAAFGFQVEGVHHFPDDHVATMMHFLGALSSRAFGAYGEGDEGRVREILAAQADFLDAHLTYWRPKFLEALDHHDLLGFYVGCARVMDAFLIDDREFLRGYLR